MTKTYRKKQTLYSYFSPIWPKLKKSLRQEINKLYYLSGWGNKLFSVKEYINLGNF